MQARPPTVLGIETSCDDTACAVVGGDGTVRSSVVSSQLAAHRPYGGVVPEIASREHLSNWPPVAERALAEAGLSLGDVDVLAATRGPGLIGALLVGLSLGRSIAYGLGVPFHAVHHIEGHLYSPFLRPPGEPAATPPARFHGLVVSGGHTTILRVSPEGLSSVAETRDDAMGEVFDKVGKRLGLAFPQGPLVDRLAEAGEASERGRFTVAACGDGSFDFSYSGLKSQALLAIEALERRGVDCRPAADGGDPEPAAVPTELRDLLADFRAAAVGQLIDRLDRLHAAEPLGTLAVSGGVAANRLLRREVVTWSAERNVDLRLVPLGYSGDNAAMIAHAALLRHRRGLADDPLAVEAGSRIAL